MKNLAVYIDKIFFFILIGGSIFFTSDKLVDPQLMPKWLWTGLVSGIIGIFISVKLLIKSNYVRWNYGFLFGTIAFFCICQTFYGLLEYFKIIPSFYYNQFLTGSFENTAGFASCLCFGFPFVLYYLKCKEQKIKILCMSLCLIVLFTLLFSLSRCGILCVLVSAFVYIFNKKKRCLWIGITVLAIIITTFFCFKKDSVSGRLLIWKCSIDMIADSPLKGQGIGAFAAHYMDYQADYFQTHPNSKYQMLADNVQHPFNEYIYLMIQYGVIAFIIILILMFFLLYCYWKCPLNETFICLLSLSNIALFSCFSYPFRYPFTWIILCVCIGSLIKSVYGIMFTSACINRLFGIIVLGCSILLIISCSRSTKSELQWKMADSPCLDVKEKMRDYYLLFPKLKHNPFYLYNYAATLYKSGEDKKALLVADYCRTYFLADYDLELLRGDLYKSCHDYQNAIDCLKQAAFMCPSRFIPLYKLYTIYRETGDSIRGDSIAEIISNKRIKIDSPIIRKIKEKIKLDRYDFNVLCE